MDKRPPRIGHYELIDRFAVGGAAELFRAYDTRDGEVVVIKRLKQDKELDAGVLAGFLRETELALRMKHKNLIHGRDRGAHGGLEYVVLEFVDGPDLSRIVDRAVQRKIRIPLEFSLYIVREILDGLDFAHNLKMSDRVPMGLVHRDINPRNVFISYDGRIRVADFGASLNAAIEEVPVEVVGSPGYLSPEQACLAPLDRRSDLFSVGCVLFELVTGMRAFDVAGKKESQVLRLHRKGEIKPVPIDVSEAVKLIIDVACSPEREDRYRTAAQMRDAIDAILREKRSQTTEVAIAALTRNLFKPEFASSRLPGSPLTF